MVYRSNLPLKGKLLRQELAKEKYGWLQGKGSGKKVSRRMRKEIGPYD